MVLQHRACVCGNCIGLFRGRAVGVGYPMHAGRRGSVPGWPKECSSPRHPCLAVSHSCRVLADGFVRAKGHVPSAGSCLDRARWRPHAIGASRMFLRARSLHMHKRGARGHPWLLGAPESHTIATRKAVQSGRSRAAVTGDEPSCAFRREGGPANRERSR